MRFLMLLLIAFSFYSCQDIEEVKAPENLLSEQKMVDVLTDLTVLNAAKNHNKRLLESKGVQPDKFLYEKHNIDSLQFARSSDYYAKNYNRLEVIYERVKQNLEELQREYEERQEEERNIPDSLRTQEKDSVRLMETDSIRILRPENPMDSIRRQPLRKYAPDTLITPATTVVDF